MNKNLSKKLLLAAVCKKYQQLVLGGPKYKPMAHKLIPLYLLKRRRQSGKRNRGFWVRTIFQDAARNKYGASNTIIKELRTKDPEMFFNYFRMTTQQFDELLNLVEPKLAKLKMPFRSPISAETRLQITLRYLADGCSMTNLQYSFRIAKQTISIIIKECCKIIWETCLPLVFPKPTEDNWLKIADGFKKRWDFDHCIGAIDGKHINIQAPANSGSSYYNYKGSHSIVLLAVATSDLKFSMVDIGFPGRQSDSAIFNSSPIGTGFRSGDFNIPKPSPPCDEFPTHLPYVLLGDEAFGLTNFLLRPYPRSGQLNIDKKNYNYRLSRARRVVESAFGILASRWRFLRRPIVASEQTVILCVQAAVCLHNFLMDREISLPLENRRYSSNLDQDSSNLGSITKTGSNMYSKKASEIRENFTYYFNNVGTLEFQMEKVLNNDY